MTGKKCAIPQHRRTLKIYSPADNRYINRGQCQGIPQSQYSVEKNTRRNVRYAAFMIMNVHECLNDAETFLFFFAEYEFFF